MRFNMNWIVYLLLCSDNTLYCGATNRLKKRLAAHNSGKGAKYTRSRRPVVLIATSHEMSRSEAQKLEYRIKQLPAGKKRQELQKQEDPTSANLKKELELVCKQIKALSKKVDKLVTAAGKTAPAKAKPKKKAAVKNKKAAVKKPALKKGVAKKAGQVKKS